MPRKSRRQGKRRRPQQSRRRKGRTRVRNVVQTLPHDQAQQQFVEKGALVNRGQPAKNGFFNKLASMGVKAAGGLIKSVLLGSGDYGEVKVGPAPADLAVNSLVKPLTAPDVPFMHNTNDWIRVTRREYIADIPVIVSPTDNAAQVRRTLNPGDAQTFPWLHNIARNYQQWLPLGMCFEYIPTCGTGIATTPNIGVIRAATQYDVYQPVFGADIRRILNHFFAVSGAPYEAITHCIECAPNQTPIRPLYIRPEAVLEHDDIEKKTGGVDLVLHRDATFDARLYDLGRFEMNNSGSVANYAGGQLWISYDIVLLKPRLELSGGFTYDSDFTVPLPDPPVLTLRNEIVMAVTDADASLL